MSKEQTGNANTLAKGGDWGSHSTLSLLQRLESWPPTEIGAPEQLELIRELQARFFASSEPDAGVASAPPPDA